MPKFQAPWVNGGKPFTMPDIPMVGDDELEAISKANAKSMEFRNRNVSLLRLSSLIGIRKLLDRGRLDVAYKAWLQGLDIFEPQVLHDAYRWSEEGFPHEFEEYWQEMVLDKYRVADVHAADDFLRLRADELTKDAAAHKFMTTREFENEIIVTSLYWRLIDAFPNITIGEQVVPTTKENLRRAIRLPADKEAFIAATRPDVPDRTPDEEREAFHEEFDEEVMEKKERSGAKSGKPSRTDTPSTSATGTATAKP